MATNSAEPAVTAQPADPLQDDYTGVYGFFRRHQKKLLYTAGLFTLLTFSVTGPMLALIDNLFGNRAPLPSIVVLGKRTTMQPEDYDYGDQLARHGNALRSVLPPISGGEGGQSSVGSSLAILRRAAIEEGLDVSMDEVDRAIDFLRRQNSADSSAAQFAQLQGFPSLAQYRDVMREGMRVGNYIRLQTLALDGSNALVIEKLLRDKEKITLRVATFDEKAAEEKMKAEGQISDDDLRKWLDGKTEVEKAQVQAFDTNRVELKIGALLLAEGQFDPAQWTDALKDFAPTEDELRVNYDREKESRWKLEGDNNYKPFEDVKAEVLRVLQAEQVMKGIATKLRNKQMEALKPLGEALQKEQQDVSAAELALKDAATKSDEKPDDAALKDEKKKAEEALTAKRANVDAARKAVEDARAAWDFRGPFEEETAGKTGFVVRQTNGRRNGEELKNLDADGLDLGQWPSSLTASSLQNKGDFAGVPSRTTKAAIVFQATDVEVRPLKSWDKLKPLVEGAWYVEKAKKLGEEKKKAFEDALLRLAKAKMADKVAELEGKRAERTDAELTAWEKSTREAVAAAETTLAGLTAGTQAQRAWQRKLDALKVELEGKDGKRVSIDLEIGKKIETEIAEEAKKHYHEVIDAAAGEAGFTVADLGPYTRELSNRPRFDKAYDPTVVFLWRSHAKLKEHESTGVLQDQANRRWICAVCTKVEPLTVNDLTRREFEGLRTGNGFLSFATLQSLVAYQQAFTADALQKRYDFQQPAGSQVVDAGMPKDKMEKPADKGQPADKDQPAKK